ncbi:hypothetical protein ABPG74_022922 [Tetrahymena malaccensis]
MSKKANKSIQKKDTKQVVLLPFSQQYNSQDSLFNEDNDILNSQYSNNIFSKPLNRDNIQFTTGNATSKTLGLSNPLFENEWENNLNDIPIQKFKTNNLNNKKQDEYKKQNQNDRKNQGQRQNEIEQETTNFDEEEEDEDDEDMYEPEYLIDKRIVNGQIEYLVKWVEFSVEESTWEPAENIQVCAFDLIQIFEDSKKQGGNKSNTLSHNRSPMLTPTQRKQMHSPNLQKNSNLSQLRGRSPLRKSQQVTPQIKSGISQQEQIIKSPIYKKDNEASPLITQNKRNYNQNNNQKQIAVENLQLSNSIQSNQNSRVFDNKLQTENEKKQSNYGKTLTPKNNKKGETQIDVDDDNIIKQVYNSQGEIIFEQKKMAKDGKEQSDKNKSPLLKLVKDSAFYQKIVQTNGNNNKTPQTTPNKQQDSSPFHTPVGKQQTKQNQNQINQKSPINKANQKRLQQENNFNLQEQHQENQYEAESMNTEDNFNEKYVPAKRGRPAQSKKLEIPPSPIMTPTPNVDDKSPISKLNRKKIYQDIQISDDLLKSPISRATPLNKTQKQKESFIPQSPPIINDQIKQSGKKKRLYKRIEISDHESSDIENIDFLDNKNNKYDDDILPAFQEYQKNTRSKGLSYNSRSQTVSTSITPTKVQGNITPNNQKSKSSTQNQQSSTPLTKNNQNNNEKIIPETYQKGVTQETTPNKRITSIWQQNKSNYQKDLTTPVKNQQINVKTPLKNVQEYEKTPLKQNSVKTPNKETRSPINKKDPKSPMQYQKSPISNWDKKSPISKQNQKSPISKTMQVEENSKRKRRRQPSSISDDELNAFKQNQQFESSNQFVTKSDLTPQKSSNLTPLKKGDLTPTRRSTRNKDDKCEQYDENIQKQIQEQQSYKDSNQVHMKLHENRVQLQAQSEKIAQVLNSSRENLKNLNQISFKIQKEENEDLYSRVKKKVESLVNQQNQQSSDQSTNLGKRSKFETPVKEKTSSYEKKTPESKSKNSRQGSAKKNKKIDPKTNLKKNDQKSATKEKQNIQIQNNQLGKGQSQSDNLSEEKILSNEQYSNEIQPQSDINESLQKSQKNKQVKNKKEDKNQQKDKEKLEKQNNLIEQQVDQNTNTLNHLEITPKTENNQKTRRASQRLSNLKTDNQKEDKILSNQATVTDQHNQVTTRRSQNNHKENEQNVQQDSYRTPVKSNSNNQKVDPKQRLTRNSIKKNENSSKNITNENCMQKQDMEIEEQKQDYQISNKDTQRSTDNYEAKQKQNSIDSSNISKIIGLLSQKKQRKGGKASQNSNKEYPQFEVELSNGEQKIMNYSQIVEVNPKMVADFLIKDYM